MTVGVFTCQSLVNWYYNVTFFCGIVLNNLSNVSFNESSNETFGKSVSSLFRSRTKLVDMASAKSNVRLFFRKYGK